jgi:type III pantothenate kinase
MRLLLDLGNSRLKAALWTAAGGLRLLGEARHRETGLDAALAAALEATQVKGLGALCANVAGDAAGRVLAGAFAARGGGPLEFLQASPAARGVRCAYPQPARLGADRWAALLGARGLCEGACLVVDAGSALTLDAMAPEGRHLGGWILPGLQMMLEVLEARTGDLKSRRQASPDPAEAGFPTDTRAAMEAGVRLAAHGAVKAAREQLETASGVPARLLVTGGDAADVLALFGDAEHVPDLVFRGLARAAG